MGRIGLLLAVVLCTIRPEAAYSAFDAHGGPVKSVAVSSDGRFALTASFDYSIILWDLKNASIEGELAGHQAAVNAVAFLPGDHQAISAGDDGSVILWDLANAAEIERFEGHEGKVVAVAVSPDGRLAASAGWDQTVRLWDLDKAAALPVLKGRDNINAVSFAADGETVIAGTSDGELIIWRAADGIRIAGIDGHEFAITDLDRHVGDGLVATASVDETVRLWKLDPGPIGRENTGSRNIDARKPLHTLYGHAGPVLCVDLSSDGTLIASGGVDGTVRVWHRGDGDRLKVFARHQGPVWSVTFTPDGETLLSGGADGLVLTYDLDDPSGGDQSGGLDLAATDGQTAETGADANGRGELGRGEKLFKTCSACHTITPDDGHKAGPTLHGLFGRLAGSHPDYHYSKALVDSDLIWTEETVDALFAIGPDHLLPGTKMPLQRMPDSQDRADLIAFLKKVTTP